MSTQPSLRTYLNNKIEAQNLGGGRAPGAPL